MKRVVSFLLFVLCSCVVSAQTIFINEINYIGSDAQQGVEIAGPSGTDLSGYELYLYDHTGNNYHVEPLSGIIPGSSYDAIWFPIAELSNDPTNQLNGGLYLEDPANSKLQFIGYGTLVAATNGPALGETPTPIGVVQVLATSNPQLIGTGLTYTDFVWSIANISTISAVNTAQSFAPLPVELLTFQAVNQENQAVLSWSTISEINNDYFVVERSTDGVVFEAIGQIEGKGTTTIEQQYTFTDVTPLKEKVYYRLKQVDKDGAFEYSAIISLKPTNLTAIMLYPNPITTTIPLVVTGVEGKATIEFYSLLGELKKQAKLDERTTIDCSDLPKGTYFYSIRRDGEVLKNGKVVIIE